MLLLAFTIGKPFGQNYDFLTTTQNKTPIFLSRNSVFALVWANRGPSPAPRQRAASPSPWERGVNGLANHRPTLICHPKILRSFANHSRTVASVPRPPATHSLLIFFRLEDGLCWGAGGRITLLAGGRGTETTVLL